VRELETARGIRRHSNTLDVKDSQLIARFHFTTVAWAREQLNDTGGTRFHD
jgi:hypothetical protein